MRIDHFAYQQATRVAGFGLLLQLAVGITLLVFGRVVDDTALAAASFYVLPGALVWGSLILVFHQHKLERLESLEREEIAAARAEGRGFFEAEGGTGDAAARRLRQMHQYLLPGAALGMAGILLLLAILQLQYYLRLDDPTSEVEAFQVGRYLGWQLAISIGLSLISFIFSRFVAGMAKQPAWQHLRGGAGVMVGTALVLLALGVGIVLQVFQQPKALEYVAKGVAWFMALAAGEVLLNFILNLYRPRRPGEFPRPAFDSRVLGLLAAPDNIVRSINEAINYQFGFEITSSWGYRLLLRSFAALLVLGAVVLVLLSTVVVVGPGQQAVRLRGGRVVGDVHQGTLLLKWPWPFETAEVVDVATIRSLTLGPKPFPVGSVNLWGGQLPQDPERYSLIVAAPRLSAEVERDLGRRSEAAEALRPGAAIAPGSAPLAPPPAEDASARSVSSQFALVDADVVMNYRIRDDGLLEYLNFCNDTRVRKSPLDMRERALRAIAMRELSQLLSTQPLDDVLSPRGNSLGTALKERIQAAFDREKAGVEVVSVHTPFLRPPGEAGEMYESLSVSTQNARMFLEEARRSVDVTMATLVGEVAAAPALVAEIRAWERLRATRGDSDPEVIAARARLERALTAQPAQVASVIAQARARRWGLHLEARRNAAEVMGQAPAYRAAPELYRQRRTMEVLAQALANVRVKYVLGLDPRRVMIDAEMMSPDPGLNLGEYLEKKDGG